MSVRVLWCVRACVCSCVHEMAHACGELCMRCKRAYQCACGEQYVREQQRVAV